MGFQHRKRASQRASKKKKTTKSTSGPTTRPKRSLRRSHTASSRNGLFFISILGILAGKSKINPPSTKKVALGSYNSQAPGVETQDDRENRILSLLRSGSYQSYVRQMSGISRKSEFVSSMAKRALVNSLGPIASTESYLEENEFEAGIEDDKGADSNDDDVFSPDSPGPSEEVENGDESSQGSLQESAQECKAESLQSPIKQPSLVSFKDAENLPNSSCKRISTPLAGKRLFCIRITVYGKPFTLKTEKLLDLKQVVTIKYHQETVINLICLITRKINGRFNRDELDTTPEVWEFFCLDNFTVGDNIYQYQPPSSLGFVRESRHGTQCDTKLTKK